MTKDHKIQIALVDRDGTETNGPLIVIPKRKRRRARDFKDDEWTKSEAINRFRRYLFRQDNAGLEAAIRALDRLSCWREAVDQLRLNRPNETHARTLVSFWITHGLSRIPRGLRDGMPALVDAIRRFLTPYQGPSVSLYRGELKARHAKGVYGISWTTSRTVAEMFAHRRARDEGPGVVLKIEATEKQVVAALANFSGHTMHLGEDEYIVDPRSIRGLVIVID